MDVVEIPEFEKYIDENGVVFNYWPWEGGIKIISVEVPENINTLNIPESIKGSPVIKLARQFANSQKNVKEIIVPKLNGCLEEKTFKDMKQLESVTFCDGIEEIGSLCFVDCINLKNINFPNTLKIICDGAFDSCSSLERLVLPKNRFTISSNTFADCTSLKYIDVGNAAIIHKHAFRGCSKLETFICSENLSSLENGVFRECDLLHSVDFSKCKSLKTNAYTFAGSSIKEFILPDTFSILDETIFNDGFLICKSAEKYIINNPEGKFFTDDGLLYKHINDNETKLVRFPASKKMEQYISPSNVTHFGAGVFAENKYLINVSLRNVKSLGKLTFFNAEKLLKVNLRSNNLTYIPEGFLMRCSSIKKFKIPSGCTHIHSDAFSQCKDLETVIFPKSIKEISDFAFMKVISRKEPLKPRTAIVVPGSYAEQYAKRRKSFVVEYSNENTLEEFLSDVVDDKNINR